VTRRHPTLKAAIEWIALNDNAGNGDDLNTIAEYVTTALIADLFGKTPESLAVRILLLRNEEFK
jgi:hypothetical protein